LIESDLQKYGKKLHALCSVVVLQKYIL